MRLPLQMKKRSTGGAAGAGAAAFADAEPSVGVSGEGTSAIKCSGKR